MAAVKETAPDLYRFLQFAGPVAVEDSRGIEELTDRARLGNPFGPHGEPVESIELAGNWFVVKTTSTDRPEPREYRVHVTSVRMARRCR